jgi:hypothetical protein
MPTPKIEDVIKRFVEIRDKRSELKKEYEAEDFKLKEGLSKIEVFLMRRLDQEKLESFKSAEGTAYIAREMKASCADWVSFWAFLAEEKRFNLLEKRVSIGGIKEYAEEKGELPPYINSSIERVVRVRRT